MDVMDQLGIPYFAYTLDEIVINRPMPQAQIDHLEFLKDPRVVLHDAIDPRAVVKLLMFINAADEETPRRLRQALQPETLGLQLIRTQRRSCWKSMISIRPRLSGCAPWPTSASGCE